MSNLDTKTMANAIRMLAVEAVQKANSGHPGAPMGMAEMAVALWHFHLKHNPTTPNWLNRDRFVLSNGHASMLLYSLLHLTGYQLSIDDLKNFRQLGSKTPGHPEINLTPGVETTTGPLGQGFANAVGMALAEKLLAAKFNRPQQQIIDHNTYVFAGDGCLMEGISHEAAALAGAWKLGKLIVLYDSNGISIDGKVEPWYSEKTVERFSAYGWEVIDGVDGHDVNAINQAIARAKNNQLEPSIIICKTSIGKGSPNRADTSKAHGEPMGEEEIKLIKQQLQWDLAPFEIPSTVYADWDAKQKGAQLHQQWQQQFAAYQQQYPDLAKQLLRCNAGELGEDFTELAQQLISQVRQQQQTVATRKASQLILEFLTAQLPELIGGSADLTSSNLTNTSNTAALRIEPQSGNLVLGEQGEIGRHINYGVREFGMAAVMNGIALHGGFIPYGGTFLTFSDYSRNAIRMAALMQQRVIHVFTHDSIGVGEDGPTHQPIEHVSSLRLIPNLDVWRPADTEETAVAWLTALKHEKTPTALILTRQNLPFLTKAKAEDISLGGYIVAQPQDVGCDKELQIVLLATGSEVQLAVAAQKLLAEQQIAARVVSIPSFFVFDQQSSQYKEQILPSNVAKVAIEAGQPDLWWKYGVDKVLGMSSYGESAPANQLFEHFGLTAKNLVAVALEVLGK